MISIDEITRIIMKEILPSIHTVVQDQIHASIAVPVEERNPFDEYTDLQLAINSMEFIKLLVQLESKFGFEFSDDELNITVFQNIHTLAECVSKKLAVQGENAVSDERKLSDEKETANSTEVITLVHNNLSHDIMEIFSKDAWLINSSIIDIQIDDQGIHITTKDLTENDLQRVRTDLKQLLESLINNDRKNKVLYQFPSKNHQFYENIMEELLRTKAVIRYSSGRYGYSGEFLEVMQWFDQQFVGFSQEFHALNMQFPVTVGFDSLNQCHYPEEFPNNLTFLSSLPRDIDIYNEYSANVSKYPKDIHNMGLLFSPTVCVHLYEALKGMYLEDTFCATVLGKCYRNEYITKDNLERLNEFSMREIVMIGTQQQVMAFRNHIMERTKDLAVGLGLEGSIKIASDPFFTSKNVDNIFYQKLYELKYEMELNVAPTRGISAASFNLHGQHFTDAFNINGSEALQSSCCAYGLERWAYAYFTQYGNSRQALTQFEVMQKNE